MLQADRDRVVDVTGHAPREPQVGCELGRLAIA